MNERCPHPRCNNKGTLQVLYRDELSCLDGAILAKYEPCPVCNGWEPKSKYLCRYCGKVGRMKLYRGSSYCRDCFEIVKEEV